MKHLLHRGSRPWLLGLFLTAAGTAQTTHLVNGPDLQTAIDAAAAGDILLVSGTYSGAGLHIAKPLHIHGRPRATISTLFTPATIEQIPAGTTMSLEGFSLSFREIAVRNCTGIVLLAEVSVDAVSTDPVAIDNCAQVAIDGCNFATGLSVSASTVLISSSNILGRNGLSRLNTPSAPGLRASNSTVTAVATRFRGGSGDLVFAPFSGIVLANGNLRLSGGSNTVTAGQATGATVDAVRGTGQLARDVRTLFQPFGGGNAIDPAIVASLSSLPVTTVNRTGLGEISTVAIDGAANDVFVLLGLLPTPPVNLALLGFEGELWVTPNAVAYGVLDAAGHFALSFPVPNLDVLRGHLIRWQGVTGDGVTVRFGEPTTGSHR